MVASVEGRWPGECRWKVASGRKVAGAIRSVANARSLQFECAKVLHEALILPVLLYSSEAMGCGDG